MSTFLLITLIFCFPALGHAHSNTVHIWEDGGYRYIQSNGIPDHPTGNFPNPGNPNTISPQSYTFRVPLEPRRSQQPEDYGHNLFGVALNGVPFDPGTAEFWNNDRNSGWNYEALSGKIPLGIDQSHAHVQPNGAYHYHGIPSGFLNKKNSAGAGLALIGYAADGFPIYYSSPHVKSSYQLKKGSRPSGPGGPYDGTFVQDYEYAAGTGNLDECNGSLGPAPEYPGGTYHYYLTETFPFVPRCLKGLPDASFRKAPPHNGREGGGPPQEAIEACSGRNEESSCSFQIPRGVLAGTCRVVPSGEKACVPSDHPPG